MLSVLDRKWREHLYEMDYLQDGIGLRAMAQRDPLVEYQREGFALWNTMNEAVKEESVVLLFHVDVQVDQPAPAAPVVEPVHVSQMLGAMAGAAEASAAGPSGGASPATDGMPSTGREVGHGRKAGHGREARQGREAVHRRDAGRGRADTGTRHGRRGIGLVSHTAFGRKVEVSGVGVGRPRTGALHYRPERDRWSRRARRGRRRNQRRAPGSPRSR